MIKKEQNTKLDNLKNYSTILSDNFYQEIIGFLKESLLIFSLLIGQFFCLTNGRYYRHYWATGTKLNNLSDFFSKDVLIPFVVILFISLNFLAIKRIKRLYFNLYISPLLLNKYLSRGDDENKIEFSEDSYYKDLKILHENLPHQYKKNLWPLNNKRVLKSFFIISILSEIAFYFSFYDLTLPFTDNILEFFFSFIVSWFFGLALATILYLIFILFFFTFFII